jgi:hypothetical protein
MLANFRIADDPIGPLDVSTTLSASEFRLGGASARGHLAMWNP